MATEDITYKGSVRSASVACGHVAGEQLAKRARVAMTARTRCRMSMLESKRCACTYLTIAAAALGTPDRTGKKCQ